MDNQQRSELDSLNRVADYNTKNQADLNTIPEYPEEKAKFDAALQDIKDAGKTQTQEGTDQSVSLAAKTHMAKTLVKYCKRAGVIARRLQKTELAGQLAGSAAVIIKADKTKALSKAANKRKALFVNKVILTNITDAIITEIDNAIAAYDSIKDAPTEQRQTKKATATDQLPVFFEKAHEAVESMYDLVFSYFEDTKPELVSAFEEAKQVITTGTHSTSITFDCLADEDGSQIRSFTITDKSKNKKVTSDDEGVVIIEHHRSGHFHFTISAPARIDVDFASGIKRGTNNHFTVKLKKALDSFVHSTHS